MKPSRIMKQLYLGRSAYPFLRSSKTLSMNEEFAILFNQKRNTLSSLEIWASSGRVSRKDICFVCVESPFLHMKGWISYNSKQQLLKTKAKGKQAIYRFFKTRFILRALTIEILENNRMKNLNIHHFSHLCWKICATNARLRFGEPSTISFAVKYLLQPILSACSRTSFALSNGSFTFSVDGLVCSGARTFKRWA